MAPKSKNNAAASAAKCRVWKPLQRKTGGIPGILRVGSHCSGWLGESQALANLGIQHRVVMASDNDPSAKKIIQDNFTVEHFYDNMMTVDVKDMPKCDLYVCGFPCQPYSTAGLNMGIADNRSEPKDKMLEYICTKKPSIIILENVANLRTRHHDIFDEIVKKLLGLKIYSVKHQILDTQEYGIPQRRKRLYIVAIRKRLLRLPFAFPRRMRSCPPLSTFMDRDRRGVIRKQKKIDSTLSQTALNNIMAMMGKLEKKGIKPFETDVIVDVNAGRFHCHAINQCPTITAARGKQLGFFHLRLKRRLSMPELMRLQGADPEKLFTGGLAKTNLGNIVGNAMSINVLEAVIIAVMRAVDKAAH